jgi:transcription initiation factor TFIIIB Brf1 subunit/transcription initiation factor TFIIB
MQNNEINLAFNDLEYLLKQNETEKQKVTTSKIKKCLCGKCLDELDLYQDTYTSLDGYITCYTCGFVFTQDRISDEKEWNIYEDDSIDKTRCQKVKKDMLGNCMLNTSIKYTRNSSYKLFSQLSKLQQYMYSKEMAGLKKEMNLKDIFTEDLQKHFSNEIINEVVFMYVNLKKTFRGEKRISMIIGLLYFVCKKYNINKTSLELSALFGISHSLITSSLTELIEEYHIQNISAPLELLDNFIGRLNISIRFKSIIEDLCIALFDLNILTTSKPQTIISCVLLFLKSKNKVSFNELDLENISSISLHTLKLSLIHI